MKEKYNYVNNKKHNNLHKISRKNYDLFLYLRKIK
jgi:hypothetical protein